MDEAGRVLYAGSFSKTLCPGLRVGFLVVPRALAGAFADSVAELYREGNMMTHAVLADFIREGHLSSHIRRVRRRYAERRACLIDEIRRHFGDALDVVGGEAGLHLILALPDGVDDTLVVRDAFGQRRKTLRNALSQVCSGDDIEAAGLRPDARAEQIAVADFKKLANHLAALPPERRPA